MNRKYQIGILAIICTVIAGIFPSPAAAISCDVTCPPFLLSVTSVIPVITYILIALAIVAFFVMLVLTGYTFITAMGNRKRLEQAKNSLGYSIGGFTLIILSFAIFPLIFKIAEVKATAININAQNGQVSVNPGSTYTATPLPISEQDTITDTAIPSTGGTNTNVAGLTAITTKNLPSATGSTRDSCGGKISYCAARISDATGVNNGLPDAIAATLDSYLRAESNGNFLVTESTVLKAAPTTASDPTQVATTAVHTMNADIAPLKNASAFINFRAFSLADANIADNFAHAGLPIIVLKDFKYVLMVDAYNNEVTYIDTTDPNSSFATLDESTFNTSISQAILLEPADGNDYIYPLFEQYTTNPGFAQAVAECLALHESSLNPFAINTANNNGSIDRGLMQINSIHNGMAVSPPPSPLSYTSSLTVVAPDDVSTPAIGSNLFNALFNTMAGYQIFKNWGNSFEPWSTWSQSHYCW